MLRNSEGCVLPSYFSGTSGLKFFVLGHWMRRSSRVNAGQPAAYDKSPGSPGARASTAFPALWSDCRRVSRRRSIVVRASSCRRSSRTWRWSRRSRGSDDAVEPSSALFPRGGVLCFRVGECTVVAPPAVLSPSAFVFSTRRGREVVGRCGVSLLEKAIRLWMVALQPSALSAAGGKSRSSCALASASAGVEGSGGERREERDMLRLLTALEGAGSPPRRLRFARARTVVRGIPRTSGLPLAQQADAASCDMALLGCRLLGRTRLVHRDRGSVVRPVLGSGGAASVLASDHPSDGVSPAHRWLRQRWERRRRAHDLRSLLLRGHGAVVDEATNSERLMKNAPARTPDQVRTTSTPPTWRAKDVGVDYPPRAPMGPGPLRLSGERAEGARRADRGEHTGGLPRFGPRWTRKTLLLLGLYSTGELGSLEN